MKKLLLILTLLLILPLNTHAQAYKNHDYKFQIDLPQGWRVETQASNKQRFIFESNEQLTIIFAESHHAERDFKGTTFTDFNQEERQKFLTTMVNHAQKSSPNGKVLSADWIDIADKNTALMVVTQSPPSEQAKYTVACSFIKNNIYYSFLMLTSRPDHKEQMLKILDTFKEI